jgi:hypothetical protein
MPIGQVLQGRLELLDLARTDGSVDTGTRGGVFGKRLGGGHEAKER